MTSLELLSNKTTPKPYSPSNSSLVKQNFNFDIQVAALGSKQRSEIEQFIKQDFLKSYQAKVSVTMPHFLTLCNGTYKAALGIRSGQEDLFIEQYLFGDDDKYEQHLQAAVKINPTGVDINYCLAEFYLEQDQYEKAKEHLLLAQAPPQRINRASADKFRQQEVLVLLAKVNKSIAKH